MQASTWALVAQVAYLLMLLGLLSSNIDLLRRCFTFGSALAVAYSLWATEVTLWVPLLWNGAFLALNVLHVGFSFSRRRRDSLDAVEEFLHQTAFANFPAKELKSFMRMGMEGTAKPGEVLVSSEKPDREIACLLKGAARVIENGAMLSEVKPGRMLGVLSCICEFTGNEVVAATEVKVFVWTAGAIEQWVGTDVKRLALIQGAMGAQLVQQLVAEQEARRLLTAQQGGVAV